MKLPALLLGCAALAASAFAELPRVARVDAQPLLAQTRRLQEALDFLGQPLSGKTRAALAAAAAEQDDAKAAALVQDALDPLCLGAITVREDATLAYSPGDAPPSLIEQGWRACVVKVLNEPGLKRTFNVGSPGARPIPNSPPDKVAERWLDIETLDRRPLSPELSGLAVEYRVVNLWARAPGEHRASITFALAGVADRRTWNYDADTDGWLARNQCRIEQRDGALIIRSEGNDPWIEAPAQLPAGEKIVRIRARTFEDTTWQIFWWSEAHPGADGRRNKAFPVPRNDGKWSDLKVQFTADEPIAGLRLDPGNNAGESAIDSIEILSPDAPAAGAATVALAFRVDPVRQVKFAVRDERGEPAMACFLIRDAQGRVYPMQHKRLAPDFFFQPQIYRAWGESVPMPDGEYTLECSRGPESVPEVKKLIVGEGSTTFEYQVRRWTDPAARGWYSGDHHIHAAGCAHYTNPTEGVHAPDMARHIMGEDLKIGSNLTWGPCFDYQKQFFTGKDDPTSRYPYLLRYDVEVSGFGSHQSGHLCLLRLRDQIPPGGTSKDHWPTLGLNTLRWAKKQGAVTGPAHSGAGLTGRPVGRIEGATDGPNRLPNFDIPPYDGIGANEFVMDITHNVPGPDGQLIPAIDFISTMDTDRRAEFNMWYHTLNCGFRIRASGETDFPCITGARVGLGRVYVKQDGKLNYDAWCEGIRQGRSYVSDGSAHLMDFTAHSGSFTTALGEAGSELRLDAPAKVKLRAAIATRRPLIDGLGAPRAGTMTVELIVNGLPVASRAMPGEGEEQNVEFDTPIERSSWVALRVYPHAHTNPIFITLAGQPIRASRHSAEWLRRGIEQCWAKKERTYAPAELDQARTDYDHARRVYDRIIAESQ